MYKRQFLLFDEIVKTVSQMGFWRHLRFFSLGHGHQQVEQRQAVRQPQRREVFRPEPEAFPEPVEATVAPWSMLNPTAL